MKENTYNVPNLQIIYAQVQKIDWILDHINVGRLQLFKITLVALMAQSIIIIY